MAEQVGSIPKAVNSQEKRGRVVTLRSAHITTSPEINAIIKESL